MSTQELRHKNLEKAFDDKYVKNQQCSFLFGFNYLICSKSIFIYPS